MTPAKAATGRTTRPNRAAAILFLKGMQAFSLAAYHNDTSACGHWMCRAIRPSRSPLSSGERRMSDLVSHSATSVQVAAIGRRVGEHDLEQLAEQLTDTWIGRPGRLNPRGGLRHRLVVP